MRTWLVGMTALLGSSSWSQTRHTLRLAEQAGYVEASVLDEQEGRTTWDPALDYHWFRAQQLQVTRGGASGRLLDGPYQAYYPSGQLREAGSYEKGTREGEWRAWSSTGELTTTVNWKGGRLHGDSIGYSKGVVVRELVYRRGKLRKQRVPHPAKAAAKPKPAKVRKDKKDPAVAEPKSKKEKRAKTRKPKASKPPKDGGKGAEKQPQEAAPAP
ncbi:MAG: hypothetical protein IPN38_12385 [Flavobacteriales bacterium]|nr:hypothetical protein [Flavobacteriales bacterium]